MKEQGFVYLWYDKAYKRFYVGCHWGTENDGYVCSSSWMLKAYRKRQKDFKRRILTKNLPDKHSMFLEELRYLQMIKPEEVRTKYYNLHIGPRTHWSTSPNAKTIAQKSGAARRGIKLGPKPEEVKNKISNAKKGKSLTEEHKAALRDARVGLQLSEDHKNSISKNHKSKQDGYIHHTKLEGWIPKPKKVGSCVVCGHTTPSSRAKFCIDHFTTKPKSTIIWKTLEGS